MIWGADPWMSGLIAVASIVALASPLRARAPQWLATLVVGLALLWLTLPSPPADSGGPVLLVTAGTTPAALEAAGLGLETYRPAFVLGHGGDWPAAIERLRDTGALTSRYPGRAIQVAGHGLDPWDAERLARNSATRARPTISTLAVPSLPAGIAHISWQRGLEVGEPLVVTGRLAPAFQQAVTLRLSGSGGVAERQIDPEDGEGIFEIEVTPPGNGRFLFDLTLTSADGRSLQIGTVDADVRSVQPPALLWLERAPSFETRHVKEWLADQGGRVAVRSMVSRDRYRYEYHNLERSDLTHLTADRLRPFEVVVLDHPTWVSLAASERRLLEGRVEAGTLGLILRLDLGRSGGERLPFGARARRIAGLDHLMVRPALFDDAIDPIAIPPFELEASGEPLITDQAGRVLALRQRRGLGSVALTAVVGSYRWALGGRPDIHRQYWLALVEGVAPRVGGIRWLLPPGPILPDEPLSITLAADYPPEVTLREPDGRKSRLSMRQHPTQPRRFSTTLWPRMEGWHQLTALDADASFWVDAAAGWTTWRLARRQRVTQAAGSHGLQAGHQAPAKPWGRLLAFALVIAALATAWIDERRGASPKRGR